MYSIFIANALSLLVCSAPLVLAAAGPLQSERLEPPVLAG